MTLLIDQATSSVDTVTETLIRRALRKLLTGRTSIIIAHRLTTIRNADYIYVLDHGKIIEEGSHNTLLQKKGLYSSFIEYGKFKL